MAKNTKWSKLVARIQALEDALAGLLSAKPPRKRKKAKAKSAAGKRKTAKAAPRKTSRPAAKATKRSKRKSARVLVAENMPIVPGVPVGSL